MEKQEEDDEEEDARSDASIGQVFLGDAIFATKKVRKKFKKKKGL